MTLEHLGYIDLLVTFLFAIQKLERKSSEPYDSIFMPTWRR